MDEVAVPRGSGFHFQLYAPELGPAVKWRLLSGNNRDMGRGVLAYPDAAQCLRGIAEMLRDLDQFEPIFVPENNNSWRWFLRHEGNSVVSSGHAYDRKVRCKEGHAQFLRFARGAQIRNDVVASAARRWSNASIDLRDRVAPPVIGLQGDRGVPVAWPAP
jgi:hypothetical protein